jgi:putative membrane protein
MTVFYRAACFSRRVRRVKSKLFCPMGIESWETEMSLLLTWLINALALLIIPYVIPSIKIRGFGTALVIAIVLGLINTLLRPVLVLLTLPVTIITLGLFILIINALLFQFAAWLLKGFEVTGFWAAFFGSILYSIISWILSALIFGRRDGIFG